MIPGILTAFLILYFREKIKAITIIKRIVIVFALILIISISYFYRNQVLYGDILGSQMEIDTMPQHVEIKSLFSSFFIIKFFPVAYHSFIGSFGWMNVKLPIYIYLLYSALFVIVFIGFFKDDFNNNIKF